MLLRNSSEEIKGVNEVVSGSKCSKSERPLHVSVRCLTLQWLSKSIGGEIGRTECEVDWD